jgi:DnaJ domain
MHAGEAYRILGLQHGASRNEVTKAWKRLCLVYHPDKNKNDHFFTEHTKKLNEAKELLLQDKETDPVNLFHDLEEQLREQRKQREVEERKQREEQQLQEQFRKKQWEEEQATRQKLQEYARLWEREAQERQRQMAEKKAIRVEVRRAKARTTKRETNRREVLVVYQGPNLDQAFVAKHFPRLKVCSTKGCIIDSDTGTKAVWLKFGRELRRTALCDSIRVHNSLVEDHLKIQLANCLVDEVIICSKDRKRLQHHKCYLSIISGKLKDAGYWES